MSQGQHDSQPRRRISVALGLGLLLAGCSSPPRPAPDRGPFTSGAGRFVLTGGGLASPLQGRYEWGKGARTEWIVFTDSWGSALGELRLDSREPSPARGWEIRDESGRTLRRSEAISWIEERLGLKTQDLDAQLPELARELTQPNILPRTLEVGGPAGGVRLRVIPDHRPAPPA